MKALIKKFKVMMVKEEDKEGRQARRSISGRADRRRRLDENENR